MAIIDHHDAMFLRMAEICGSIPLTYDEGERRKIRAAWQEIAEEVRAEVERIHEGAE